MAQNYKITAVKPEPKPWNSQYGPMLTYIILVEGRETPVELNKKPDSAAPVIGDDLYGDINRTEYGDKFKSAAKPFAPTAKGGYSPKPQADQFTMYLSYAKDIAIALLEKGKLDEEAYGEILDAVLTGGKTLYEGREGAKSENTDLLKDIDNVFKDEEEKPWIASS